MNSLLPGSLHADFTSLSRVPHGPIRNAVWLLALLQLSVFVLFSKSLQWPFWPASFYIAEDGLELISLLPLAPKVLDCRHAPAHSVYMVLGTDPRALCMLGKHAATGLEGSKMMKGWRAKALQDCRVVFAFCLISTVSVLTWCLHPRLTKGELWAAFCLN